MKSSFLIYSLIIFHLFCLNIIQGFAQTSSPLSKTEIITVGEKMYREGILPDGKPMKAYIRGDVEVDGRSFSCSSCHLRAGLGSFEGGIITPPTTGLKLYQPYKRILKPLLEADQAARAHYAATVVERPAYNREAIAKAIRYGVDSAGHRFNDIMPRYQLDENSMSILIDYLEQLSAEYSPGVNATGFSFATIITDEVPQAERDAMLTPLKNFIAETNNNFTAYQDFIKFGYIPTPDMKYAFNRAELHIWELKGAPETWKQQLRAYQKDTPVFAILGGISKKDWRPIHEFCEEERIPALFPITDFPVVSKNDWYTYYFNKGYYQEGEAVARYLSHLETTESDLNILQLIQDSPAGKRLSQGFEKSWNEQGGGAIKSVVISKHDLEKERLINILKDEKKTSLLLLWMDSSIIRYLPEIIQNLPPDVKIFVSSEYLGKETVTIPESLRNQIYITFPYRLTPFVGNKEGGFDSRQPLITTAKDIGKDRIIWKTITMLKQVTLRGLSLLYNNRYRDHLFDIMSMQMDVIVPDYERFSFGPGQRYASKGCYIIQLGKGENPPIIRRSEWVMQ